MKQLKLITPAIMIATGMTFIACNSSTEKSEASNTEKTTDMMTTTNEQVENAEAYPVGEVGKFLQESINSVTLSARLKDKFGGFKRFLEKLPEEFLLCNDHPFNPQVLPKKLLTVADVELVSRGLIPLNWTAKYRKVCNLCYLCHDMYLY